MLPIFSLPNSSRLALAHNVDFDQAEQYTVKKEAMPYKIYFEYVTKKEETAGNQDFFLSFSRMFCILLRQLSSI